MASLATAARDIPQASLSRDNLTAVAARSDQARTVTRSRDLPTPPNSISPGLSAHGLKAQLQKHRLEPVDSDLDLGSASTATTGSGSGGRSVSPALESAGAISSSMLAKYYLPDILLNHGPLAIRHIMGYLTTSVPGFSGIPPTKARRVVVGALEGRGGEGGGVQGDVVFEKVGWGRWDARRRGQAAPRRQATLPSGPSSYTAGIPISKASAHTTRGQEKMKLRIARSRPSSGGESFVFSYDGRDLSSMMEHEADRMSMDGSSGSASCSEAPEDDVAMNDDPEDVTDDEDWAAVGAAALRAESYPHMPAAESGQNALSSPNTFAAGGLRNLSTGYGMARPPQSHLDICAFLGTSDAQEREAVEALLRLGSV